MTTPTPDILASLDVLRDLAATDELATSHLERLFAEAATCADVYGETAREDYIAGYVARGVVQALAGAAS